MTGRAGYRYYDAPQHAGVLPRHLRQLLRSECLLTQSLQSFVRWRVELYGIREGWIVMWDGLPMSVSYEEVCLEERECDSMHLQRTRTLSRVSHALTRGSCARRA
jgi:hypothetical protein